MHNREILRKFRDYDEFKEQAEQLGWADALPDVFHKIPDFGVFSPKELAPFVNKSEATVRRWIRDGKIDILDAGHYQIKGIDFKRFLYHRLTK